MRTLSHTVTALLAILVLIGSCLFETKDGGNTDFYWKPLMWAWLAITAYSFLPTIRHPTLLFIRRSWWLQIITPVVFFALSIGLVRLYEPHPIRLGRHVILFSFTIEVRQIMVEQRELI